MGQRYFAVRAGVLDRGRRVVQLLDRRGLAMAVCEYALWRRLDRTAAATARRPGPLGGVDHVVGGRPEAAGGRAGNAAAATTGT